MDLNPAKTSTPNAQRYNYDNDDSIISGHNVNGNLGEIAEVSASKEFSVTQSLAVHKEGENESNQQATDTI